MRADELQPSSLSPTEGKATGHFYALIGSLIVFVIKRWLVMIGMAISGGVPKKRDYRLDLARGIMLLIIFIAHVPNNLWADFIPARFGFSSGAEIFVFVSGIASGLAFGGTFLKKGFLEGSKRIARRILQLYGAHLCLLLLLAPFVLALDQANGNATLAERYGLELLRYSPFEAILAYLSLRYVPAFFDILPMYVILLGLVPPAILLARLEPRLVLMLSAILWFLVPVLGLHLSGHPVTGANWYFNPFAWQFLFLIGFSLGIGWLKAPPRKQAVLFPAAVIILLISIPMAGWPFFTLFDGVFVTLNSMIYPADAITILHITRLLHFLSLAYVSYSLVDPHAAWLQDRRLQPLYSIGRNSFPCFLAGVVLSLLGGVVIDWLGMGWVVALVVNLAGMALLMLFARTIDDRSSPPKSEASTVTNDGGKAASLA